MESDIKSSITNRLGILITQYNNAGYADISNYYEIHISWKSNDFVKHPLFECINSECSKQLNERAKLVIQKHVFNKGDKTSAKFKELCSKLDVHELIDVLNEIFKFHTSMLYSHHSMIIFHEQKQSKLLINQINLIGI